MFVLIWIILLFSGRDTSANSAAPVRMKKTCYKLSSELYCITLNEESITAEAGLCVVIPCSFIPGYYFTTSTIVWFKCDAFKSKCVESDIIFHSNKNDKVQSEFRGRVSALQPDVRRRNCSVVINDLKESDSGTYQLRINGLLYDVQSGLTFPPRSTLTVTGLSQKPSVVIPPLAEGQQTKLTCTAPGLCSGSRPEITWRWSGEGGSNSLITENITDFHTENLTVVTQRHSSTLTFNLSSEHHGTNVTCKVSFREGVTTEETVTLNVSYTKEVKITGDTNMREGETLNLTCSVDSFPPANVSWTRLGAANLLQNISSAHLQEERGVSSVFISNVTVDDSGFYICTAKHTTKTLSKIINITVTWFSKILNGSGCVLQSEVLTCVCISEGVPLPTITWPLLKAHTEYSVTTAVSNNTINSTLSLTGNYGNVSVECFSSNENGEAKANLTVQHREGTKKDIMGTFPTLEVIVAFLTGVLLSANVLCLIMKCKRMKQRNKDNLDDTLEMINTQDPLVYECRAAEDNQTKHQKGTEAVAAEKVVPELNVGPNDVAYASIDFSKLKKRSFRKAAKELENTNTEYAEIKTRVKKETNINGEVKRLEGKEEALMATAEEEFKKCVLDEQGGRAEAVYATVKEVMDES